MNGHHWRSEPLSPTPLATISKGGGERFYSPSPAANPASTDAGATEGVAVLVSIDIYKRAFYE